MQPWQTFVASGGLRDRLREQMMTRVQSKVAPNQDHKDPKRTIGQITDRRRECAVLYRSMDIDWDTSPRVLQRAETLNFLMLPMSPFCAWMKASVWEAPGTSACTRKL